MATLTIRVIKSFEYRTTKNIILHDVSLSTTVKDLKDLLQKRISTDAGFKPYRTTKFDTLKTYFKSHGSKSQNLIINIDQSGFLEDEKTLEELGIGFVFLI